MSDKIDKLYDLVEKVYIELQDTKGELKSTKSELKDDIRRVENKVTRIETILENEIKPDIKTLYKCQVQAFKKLEEHDKRFDSQDKSIEELRIEVRALSAKTQRHSYEIGAIKRTRKAK
jgi:DNA repair ATPase RecN